MNDKYILWSIIVCAGLVACERPFVAPVVPSITIIEPSLGALLYENEVVLKASATSFRAIDRLEREGRPMFFDEEEGVWVDTLQLQGGINTVEITAFDIEEIAGTEVIELIHLSPRFIDNAPSLPTPWRVGGHTATRLMDGSILVVGGAPGATLDAYPNVFILPPQGDSFSLLPSRMDVGRIGHTATLLPDGTVLILGGSKTGALRSASDLAATALVYNPTTDAFRQIPFNRSPIQRAEHVTFASIANNQLFIDVFGGRGSADGNGGNGLVTRDDLVTYVLQRDTLFFIERSSGLEPAFGLSSALLEPELTYDQAAYLVTGNRFFDGGSDSVNFTIDFSALPVQLDYQVAHKIPRIEHASATIDDGLIIFIGGYQGRLQTVLTSNEVFVRSRGVFERIDGRFATRPRFAHTATKVDSERILVLGGFGPNGLAIENAQYLVWK